MPEYDKAYYRLFNAITDALEAMNQGFYDLAEDLLISAQQDAEETCISSGKQNLPQSTPAPGG